MFPFYFNFSPHYDQQHHQVNDVLILIHKKDKLIMVYIIMRGRRIISELFSQLIQIFKKDKYEGW